MVPGIGMLVSVVVCLHPVAPERSLWLRAHTAPFRPFFRIASLAG
jgi:hypothetical protein